MGFEYLWLTSNEIICKLDVKRVRLNGLTQAHFRFYFASNACSLEYWSSELQADKIKEIAKILL